MSSAPPTVRTITESIVSQLRNDIRTGQIAPGSRLRQVEVATRFAVSTTPVREAFAALEREGLLVSVAHRGVVVFHPTLDDLRETYEIRIPLEALATERAVENMTDGDIDDLRRLLAEMGTLVARPNRYTVLNDAFHARIYQIANRPKLQKLISDLRDASQAYLHVFAAITPIASDTQYEHTLIFEACEARDPKAAAEAMTAHLRHTVELVAGHVPED